MRKVAEVQGLRAIAILLVAGYHYFAGWTMPIDGNNLYPGTFAPLFKYTYLGVELFFMVSGFVISMTLLRTPTIRHFAIKRFVRLWPALVIALPLVFVIGNLFGPEMYAHPWPHLLSSFTLMDPLVLNNVFGTNLDWVTAVLWTMWIEIQFYVLAALLFYWRRKFFEIGLILFAAITTAILWAGSLGWLSAQSIESVLPSLSNFLPWFIAGVIFHSAWEAKRFSGIQIVVLISILANEYAELWYNGKTGAIAFPVTFFFAFMAIINEWQVAKVLRRRALVFLGEISYEFYLVHDTIGVTAITKMLGISDSNFGHFGGAVVGLTLSVVFAWTSYLLAYPWRRNLAKRWLSHKVDRL